MKLKNHQKICGARYNIGVKKRRFHEKSLTPRPPRGGGCLPGSKVFLSFLTELRFFHSEAMYIQDFLRTCSNLTDFRCHKLIKLQNFRPCGALQTSLFSIVSKKHLSSITRDRPDLANRFVSARRNDRTVTRSLISKPFLSINHKSNYNHGNTLYFSTSTFQISPIATSNTL